MAQTATRQIPSMNNMHANPMTHGIDALLLALSELVDDDAEPIAPPQIMTKVEEKKKESNKEKKVKKEKEKKKDKKKKKKKKVVKKKAKSPKSSDVETADEDGRSFAVDESDVDELAMYDEEDEVDDDEDDEAMDDDDEQPSHRRSSKRGRSTTSSTRNGPTGEDDEWTPSKAQTGRRKPRTPSSVKKREEITRETIQPVRRIKKRAKGKRWTEEWDEQLLLGVERFGHRWKEVSEFLNDEYPPRSCEQRFKRVLSLPSRNEAWSEKDLQDLEKLVRKHGRHKRGLNLTWWAKERGRTDVSVHYRYNEMLKKL